MGLDATYQTIVNVGVLIVAVYGVIKAVDGLYDTWKKHSAKDVIHKELEECKRELNDELQKCKEKLDFHSELLDKDKRHFEVVDSDISLIKNDILDVQSQSSKQFEVLVKFMLAISDYVLQVDDDNKRAKMEDAKQSMIDYLARN